MIVCRRVRLARHTLRRQGATNGAPIGNRIWNSYFLRSDHMELLFGFLIGARILSPDLVLPIYLKKKNIV